MHLEGKRLALLGFGVENRALGAWLAAQGLSYTVCDGDTACRDRDPAAGTHEPTWEDAVDEWRLGDTALSGLGDFDILFRSPGIPVSQPELVSARWSGARLSSGIDLFLSRCPAPVVGVTGTKGKGTTASLLMAILDAADLPARLGGNIGTPPVAFLDELRAEDLVVLELSSFQLQDLGRSPQGAVLLPVAADHLDYHKTRSEYVAAKGEICRHQSREGWVLAAAGCSTALELAGNGAGRRLTYDRTSPVDGDGCWVEGGQIWWRDGGAQAEPVASTSDVRIRGDHNLGNACAAVAAALLAGAGARAVPAGLQAFAGLGHRLEEVGESAGVLYVNDSLATTPEAAAAGLLAWADRRVILIVGGSSKGADFALLGKAIAAEAAALVTIGQEGPRIVQAARAAGFTGPVDEDRATMVEAVAAAAARATPGDVVLLSPACASFGMFASYAERGEAFRRAVAT